MLKKKLDGGNFWLIFVCFLSLVFLPSAVESQARQSRRGQSPRSTQPAAAETASSEPKPNVAPQPQPPQPPPRPVAASRPPTRECTPPAVLRTNLLGVEQCMVEEVRRQPIWPLVGAGFGALAGSYFIRLGLTSALIVGSWAMVKAWQADLHWIGAAIPVLGPILQVIALPGNEVWPYIVLIAIHGLIEPAGLVLGLIGLLGGEVREWKAVARQEFQVLPFPSDGPGLSVQVRF
ncbi:MAG: hypothetical protein NZM37_11265 [Sandaracinaceae bacterium]|nr:hypothetical protein [Sandaracinaceae bacterium]